MMFSLVPLVIVPTVTTTGSKTSNWRVTMRLQGHDDLAGHRHRVLGAERRRPVAALADDPHVELVAAANSGPGRPNHMPDAGRSEESTCRAYAALDPPAGRVEQALGDHRLGAARALLAGLEHEHDVAGELVPQLVQDPGRADQRRRRAGRGRRRASGRRAARRRATSTSSVTGSASMSPRSSTRRRRRRLPRSTAVTDESARAEGDLEVEAGERLEHQRLGLRQVEAELGHLVQGSPQGDQLRADLLGELLGDGRRWHDRQPRAGAVRGICAAPTASSRHDPSRPGDRAVLCRGLLRERDDRDQVRARRLRPGEPARGRARPRHAWCCGRAWPSAATAGRARWAG